MKIFKENVILKALKESDINPEGLTIDQYARDICDGHMDVDVCDEDVDMLVAFCYDVDSIDSEYPEMDKFLEKLAKNVKITKEVKNPYGSTLVCDFTSYLKPFNEEWKEFFDMDNSEFSEDEAYYEAVDNLEALISGNAGEKTYKAINDILDGKKEESVNESLKESINSRLNKEAIAKFIEKAVNDLMTTDYTNNRYILDDDLAIFVGWSDGYDDKEILDYELYKENSPTWRINVGIKVRNDWDWADYDFLDFPWYPDGEVWDTGVTVNKDEDYGKIADWMIENYPNIVEAHEKGEIFYTRDEEEASKNMNESLASNSGQKSISKNIKVMNYKGTYIVLYHGHNEKEFKDEKSAFDYARKLAKEKKENLEESEKEIINPEESEKEIINPEDKDYNDGKLFEVGLWSGAGYSMATFRVYARHPEDALNQVVAYCEKEGDFGLITSVEDMYKMVDEDFADELKNYPEEEPGRLNYFGFIEEYLNYIYVDATMEGASQPYFVRGENFYINEIKDKESMNESEDTVSKLVNKVNELNKKNLSRNELKKELSDLVDVNFKWYSYPEDDFEFSGHFSINDEDYEFCVNYEDKVRAELRNESGEVLNEEVTFSEPTKATDPNKQSRQVRDFLDYELEDDDTETGGISFNGETVRDFIADTGIKDTDSIDTLNKALTTCGIRPINEGYADDKYRGDDYWKLSDAYVNGDLSDRELAFELINLFSSRSAAMKAYNEITDGKEFPKTEFEPESEIKEISPEEASQYIMDWNNDVTSVDKGRYLTKDGNKYIGIDNRSGNCWVEEFPNKGTAMDWLEDRIEADGSINESVDEFGNKETTYLINDGEYAISILEKNPVGGEADLLVKAKDGKGSSAILPGYDQIEGFEFTEDDEPFYSDSAIDSYDIIKLVNKFIPDLKVVKIDRLLDNGNLENVMGGLEDE